MLRGVAILGIVLHNFCHWLGLAVKENEYTYVQHNVDRLWQVLASPDEFLPVHLLSFFGHYGVPVFLFLSAYGLVMKYEQGTRGKGHGVRSKEQGERTTLSPLAPCSLPLTSSPSIWPFVRYHFLKLFKMMVVGFVAFLLVDHLTPRPHYYTVGQFLGQLAMCTNLMDNPGYDVWPGPYWFFGLMLQLYVVYRLLLHRRHWGVAVALMLVCTLAQLCFAPESKELDCYRYNFMGSMLPFGLGLLYARYGQPVARLLERRSVAAAVVVACTALMFPFSEGYWLWMWAPVVVCAWSVALAKLLSSPRPWWAWLYKALEWVGGISAALFVMHPATRKVFIPMSHHGAAYQGLLIYLFVSLAVAWLCKELMRKIPSPRLDYP